MADPNKDEVIVEFIADDSDIQSTVKTLENMGKVDKGAADSLKKTNAELEKRAALMARAAAQQKKSVDASKQMTMSLSDFDKKVKESAKIFMEGFVEQLTLELKEARGEIDKLKERLGKTKPAAEGYRAEMKKLTEQLVNLRNAGKQNSEEYENTRKKLGELRDTLKDVGAEANAVGSDTAVFDGLISAASGITAGFSVAQGSLALFGETGEETQEMLLKVNAAMAVLQGLQQIGNTLQKESAASLLFLNNARKTDIVTTALATGAESKNIIVKTASAAASRALSAAMSLANPITLAVVAVITAVTLAYKFFTKEAKEAEESQKLLNLQLEAATAIADEFDKQARLGDERDIQRMKEKGNTAQEIREKELKNLYELRVDASTRELQYEQQANAAREKLRTSTNENEIKRLKDTIKFFEDFQDKRIALDQEIFIKESDNRIQAEKERKEAEEKRKADEDKARADKLAKDREAIEQEIAGYKLLQVPLEEQSVKWLEIQKDIADATGRLNALGQEANKFKLSIAEAAKEVENLNQKILEARVQTVDNKDNFANRLQTGVDEAAPKIIGTLRTMYMNIQKMEADAAEATAAIEEENYNKRIQKISAFVAKVSEIYGTLSNSINAAFAAQEENERIRIENDRKRVEEKVALGELTVKEAAKQNERLDRDARALQRRAAQRDKITAIFEATINVAQAVTKALNAAKPPFNYILAAAVAAFGLVQINAIRNRPLPNFYKGKKASDRYEGPAHVAEFGAELRERGGRMYLEKKPRVAWIGRDEIIHSASETKKILARGSVKYQSAEGMRRAGINENASIGLDSETIGREIAKHIPGVSMSWDKDGFNVSVIKGIDKINYLDNRRRF